MKACKCDACGELFNAPIATPDVRINVYTHPYGDVWLDLCPDCQIKLEDFIHTKRTLNTKRKGICE